ncbi:MOSC domain-containing protein [Sphingomonas sp.]|uniref:MOSC domain-containing protein n=1 Tax=Sphingomonas sp. TaxID=28214 RepID=UPI003B005F5C
MTAPPLDLPVAVGTGVLAGIARKARPKAPMEVLDRAEVTCERGVEGDFRGLFRPGGRNRRQVTLFERGDWLAACAEVGVEAPWWLRRCNLLVDGIDLPQRPGALLRVGEAWFEVTVECDPCSRMDAVAPGMFRALVPDWRGGVCTRVVSGGAIVVGDTIEVVG